MLFERLSFLFSTSKTLYFLGSQPSCPQIAQIGNNMTIKFNPNIHFCPHTTARIYIEGPLDWIQHVINSNSLMEAISWSKLLLIAIPKGVEFES